jgi:hypothetical protein
LDQRLVIVAFDQIIAIGIEQRIGPIGLGEFSVGDGSAAVGPAGELEYLACHRRGNLVGGELGYERVESFPGRLA